jgi:hypothetical protein
MTSTFAAARTGSGKTSNDRMLAAWLTTATADTPNGQRVRGLLDELGEIALDREMARRFDEPGEWPAELDREERDVWDHIFEALSSANTKEEQ